SPATRSRSPPIGHRAASRTSSRRRSANPSGRSMTDRRAAEPEAAVRDDPAVEGPRQEIRTTSMTDRRAAEPEAAVRDDPAVEGPRQEIRTTSMTEVGGHPDLVVGPDGLARPRWAAVHEDL